MKIWTMVALAIRFQKGKLREARFESNGAISFVEEVLRHDNLQVAAWFLSTLSAWFLV